MCYVLVLFYVLYVAVAELYIQITLSKSYYSGNNKKVFEEEYNNLVDEYNKIINSNLYADYISSIIKNKYISI